MSGSGSAGLRRFGATTATLIVLAAGACENPQPPAACGAIPQVTVNAGETATVTACFDDPNGDMLSYSATSSNPGVATASISGTNITVSAVAPGNTSVTVTATDPGGLQSQQNFQVTVPNRPPEPRGTIPSITIPVGRTETVDVSSYFAEPDGEALTYDATSSNPAAATVSVAGSTVTVTAVAKGTTDVTVTATDPEGLAATQSFQSMVPNRSPEPVGTIPDQTVHVGETVTVDLSPYFEDPDGDPLTYTAASSNSAVATASVSGSTVTITAVATGSATITLTARDPGDLTGTQQAGVTVQQLNRAPLAVGTIPALTLAPGGTTTIDASGYFSDPDGDALTYTATSSNSAVATASVSGSTVTITAVATGSATITVTARDPGGLTATQQARITVTAAGFRDDFNSSASLADWQLSHATVVVNNGVLELTNTSNVGLAARRIGSPITAWTIEARMGRKQTTHSLVNVRWSAGHARYTLVDFVIGNIRDTNYSLWFYDSEDEEWVHVGDASGNSTAINGGAGELTTIRLSFIDGRLKGVAGNTELFNFATSDLETALFGNVRLVGLVSEVTESDAVRTVLFDWIDVDGVPVSNAFLADESAILNGIDARELPKEGPDVGVLSAKSLEISGAVRKRRNQ